MIKSFRGKLDDGEQRTIRLSTPQGLIGYRIKKLNVITSTPGNAADESVVSLWLNEQDTPPTSAETIDFDNSELLGIGYWSGASSSGSPFDQIIIFDNTTFNQDIYVTHTNNAAGTATACNYYLELEQIKLNLNEATVATLKDLRGSE